MAQAKKKVTEAAPEISLTSIFPNPDQPRKLFPQEELEELAQSIEGLGLIEPLVVVKRGRKFMLVAGERRWRACKKLDMTMVPVRVIKATDAEIAEMALVENLQRQDLTPLEEARAYKKLLDNGHTVDTLTQKLGFKHKWKINWRVSLLNLSEKYQDALSVGVLTPFEAYEMSRLHDPAEQDLVYRKIKTGSLRGRFAVQKFVSNYIDAKQQRTMFERVRPEQAEVVRRWDRTLEAAAKLIMSSFSDKDCRVLEKVCQGNQVANIEKIDMIIKHLKMIRAAMVDADYLKQASKEVVNAERNLQAGS